MYKRLYLFLFNRVMNAIEKIGQGKANEGLQILIKAQQDCEEMYISQEEDE